MTKYISQINNPILESTLPQIAEPGAAGEGFFATFLPALVSLTLVAGTIIFFFIFLIGAIQWIMSGGDKAGLESAKGKLTNALIGIFILFSTFAVMTLIENFFGINILTLDIGPLKIR